MRYLGIVCALLSVSGMHLQAQVKSFYLSYYYAGLGSNYWLALHDSSWEANFYPQIVIKGQELSFKIGNQCANVRDKDTSWDQDTFSYKVKFRNSSIDSITQLLGKFKDTTIFECNHCIMSGDIHFLNIAVASDTIRYELMNTFDTTALKIAEIVNNYLPADNRIWATREYIQKADDCMEYLREQWAKGDKKKK